MNKTPKLSIIIVNYNTKHVLNNCLESLYKLRKEINFEVIVSDNNSIDESADLIRKKFPWVKLILNNQNLGFAKGNNVAKKIAKGRYILFLNPDTVVKKNTLLKTVKYFEDNINIGAVTCKILLPSGKLDKDVRRAFPTPWVTFSHFSGLDRIFPKSMLFAKYWYGYLSEDIEHEIDVLQGAYFLSTKKILDSVAWFDEDYFLNGEDIDLSWKIKMKELKNIYYPVVSIIHVKKVSKNKNKSKQSMLAGVSAMEIFYKKRLWHKYPFILNVLVLAGIKFLKITRLIKYYIS